MKSGKQRGYRGGGFRSRILHNRGEHVATSKNFMTKKSSLHPGKVWLEALCDFENELHAHIEEAEKDQLRLQTGRLYRSLIKRIKTEAKGEEEWRALVSCYRFVADTSRHLGYDEARRLHGEEMQARELSSARSFCSRPVSPDELLSRARSIASWMEAQTSFSFWLVFKDLRQAWRGNTDKRARAIQALYLSKLPQKFLIKTTHRDREIITARFWEGRRIGTNYDNKPWTDYQWKDILEQAARLTEKRYDCTELEKWVWWCHPVFRRYGWNTREVQEAAIQRGFTEADEMDEANFRRRLITIGLRVNGRKQKQDRTPPLAEFVRNVVLPDPEKVWGSLGGFLTKKN
jgi:hypothetical protein